MNMIQTIVIVIYALGLWWIIVNYLDLDTDTVVENRFYRLGYVMAAIIWPAWLLMGIVVGLITILKENQKE